MGNRGRNWSVGLRFFFFFFSESPDADTGSRLSKSVVNMLYTWPWHWGCWCNLQDPLYAGFSPFPHSPHPTQRIANENKNCQDFLADLSPPNSYFRLRWLRAWLVLWKVPLSWCLAGAQYLLGLGRCLSERCYILKLLGFTICSQLVTEVRNSWFILGRQILKFLEPTGFRNHICQL